jgi:hypothetical protein
VGKLRQRRRVVLRNAALHQDKARKKYDTSVFLIPAKPSTLNRSFKKSNQSLIRINHAS